MRIDKHSPAWPQTPTEAWDLADAIGRDAGNNAMRKAGRKAWSRNDYAIVIHASMEMRAVFGVLNRWQWMPEGMTWSDARTGEWEPVAIQ